ncbi:putative MFS family arabinose efflux permease [Rhodococcus sp. 27YEA15]|uniref:MFS transporter n=1 Tax=Rhodococcus sp. 27YEA15 TaxID=3156259 RepID=UPI003C7C6D27
MTQVDLTSRTSRDGQRLPLAGLLALGTAGFLTLLTETLPAGVLPAMSRDLGISESSAGQSVTVFAIGSVLAAVPLTKLTIGWPRRRLLMLAISGFAVANTVTAISSDFRITLASRFLAGVVAGLLWALLAGYARRMVAPHQQGKAMAIAMVGAPLALSVGVPAGAFLARVLQWRVAFASMSVLTVALMVWVIAVVPKFAGTSKESRLSIPRTLRIPGLVPILFVTLTYVLAHNLLYTYISSFLTPLGMASRVDVVLLTFGMFALVGIWLTGTLIDRHLRALTIASCSLFAGSALMLGVLTDFPLFVYVGVGVWGLAFGGIATLLQTASAQAAGEAGDVAQSLIVTCWNIGIAGGGALGGFLIAGTGPRTLAWAALALLIPALLVAIGARDHGFPSVDRSAS